MIKDIIKRTAEAQRFTQEDTKLIYDEIIRQIRIFIREMPDDHMLVLRGLCTVRKAPRVNKIGRNPKKPDEIYELPPATNVKFKQSPSLWKYVNAEIAFDDDEDILGDE
jgi:nucleoid DNA-binding protein